MEEVHQAVTDWPVRAAATERLTSGELFAHVQGLDVKHGHDAQCPQQTTLWLTLKPKHQTLILNILVV